MRCLASATDPVVSATDVTKVYRRGRDRIAAVNQVSFEILRGEFVAITGPSGAGKTTLLNLLGCLEALSSGVLNLMGKPVQNLNETERTLIRRNQVGFVFQDFGLLPTLSVAENIALPGLFARRSDPRRVEELLVKVGLEHRRDHRPRELSGGEMQRVAIARGLFNRPDVLLADEPTGNLDTGIGQSIIRLLQELNADGLTIVVVTHNPVLAQAAQRRMEIVDGRLRKAYMRGEAGEWCSGSVEVRTQGTFCA